MTDSNFLPEDIFQAAITYQKLANRLSYTALLTKLASSDALACCAFKDELSSGSSKLFNQVLNLKHPSTFTKE
jgi:hypothetical protein